MPVPEYKLSTGANIPAVGFGTWKATGDAVYQAVKVALEAGYRHIDTAWLYGNEEDVGRAIKDSGIARKDLFVTTKLWSTFHRRPEDCLDSSLERMQLDYVDLYLMHWPVPLNPNGDTLAVPRRADGTRDLDDDWDFIKTWELMQKLPKEKARAIGVSNFSTVSLDKLLNASTTTTVPAVNQFEIHPLLPQQKLIDYCKSKGILVEAFCPLGSGEASLMSSPVVGEIANKKGVQPGQILISWALHRGYVVLPKSVTPERIKANLNTVSLSDEEVQQISALGSGKTVRVVTPDWGYEWIHD